MAVQNLQKSTEITFEINLNETFVGKRRLRYMYFHEPNIVSTIPDKTKECVPLFLGCDVLDECSHSSGNLPRFHAKHGKLGLATKVNFQSGLRIVGIHGTTRGVWFYSIQGLFKIAFQYFTRIEQKSCLFKLRDVWQRQILDPILMPEINVIFKNTAVETVPPCGLSLEAAKENISSAKDTMKTLNADEFASHVNAAIDSYITENSIKQYEVKHLKVYLSYMKEIEKPDSNSFVHRTMHLVNACLQILPILSKQHESLEISEHTPTDDNNPMSSSSFYTPKPSYNSLNNSANQNCALKEEFASSCQEAVLCEVADWLGKEFSYYHDKIIEKVTLFKQGNIENIENLPRAKELVEEVFPKFMHIFFCSWMHVLPLTRGEIYEGLLPVLEHRVHLYPIIQLILELANESLVSGVAHVLVSQLLQSDSVQ